MKRFSTRGVSVVEVLIGVAIFSLITVFTTATISLFLNTAESVRHKTRATYLASEGQEVMRYLRDENWNQITALAVDTTYYFDLTASDVATSTTAEVIDGTYTRSVMLKEVYRDSDDDVVASTTSGAAVDAGSRYVITTVTWGSERVRLQTILTNIFNI